MFRESSKVVDSSIPQPHYGSQLCIDNLGISGRGRRGERFVVKDCSEEDETLRLRYLRSAKVSACAQGRSCLRGVCIDKRTEFPAAFRGSSRFRSLRVSLRSGLDRTMNLSPRLPLPLIHYLQCKASLPPLIS